MYQKSSLTIVHFAVFMIYVFPEIKSLWIDPLCPSYLIHFPSSLIQISVLILTVCLFLTQFICMCY